MIALNTQPIEKVVRREDGALDVVDVWSTIQGEGPFAGHPAVFVRLAGCDLQCPVCDTDYTSNRRMYLVSELVSKIHSIRGRRSSYVPALVVVTGGEPFRQGCGQLAKELLQSGYQVQFEVNGTLYDETLSGQLHNITIVCSPKAGKVDEKLKPFVHALKYVVAAGAVDPEDGLPTDVLGSGVRPARPWPRYHGPVYLQPQDDQDGRKNAANIQAAVDSCLQYGYILSLQLHKLVGLA